MGVLQQECGPHLRNIKPTDPLLIQFFRGKSYMQNLPSDRVPIISLPSPDLDLEANGRTKPKLTLKAPRLPRLFEAVLVSPALAAPLEAWPGRSLGFGRSFF